MNTIHKYDEIRAMPTVIANVHESIYSRSYHVLQVAKQLLKNGVPGEQVLEAIQYLETPLPKPEEVKEIVDKRMAAVDFDAMAEKAEMFDLIIKHGLPPENPPPTNEV